MTTITLRNAVGNEYKFTVYTPEGNWHDVGGIYAFVSQNREGRWPIHYIGQTNSFKNRFNEHDRWKDACKAGATHIAVLVIKEESTRLAVEKALIAYHDPKLNEHHRQQKRM